jgi:capsule polysaccharide modification protein KpsS
MHIVDRWFLHKTKKVFSYQSEHRLTDPTNIISSYGLPVRYVFVPMQVADDSQLLVHSHWITNNEMLINTVVNVVYKYSPNVPIVVKPHPSEYRRIDYQKLRETFPTIYFSQSGTLDLIKNAIMVITINSTVGFEATIFQKPVILLGEALYSVSNLISTASNEHELFETIQKHYGQILSRRSVEQFAESVFLIHVPCDFMDPKYDQLQLLWERIQALIR